MKRKRGHYLVRDLRFDDGRVLFELVNTTDPWQIAGRARLDFPRLVRTLRRLRRKGLVRISRGRVTLTPNGRNAVRRHGLRASKAMTRTVKTAKRQFERIAKRRPSSISLYDQGYMTVDSVIARAELITRLGDADSKRIAILGDDDLLSIALCLCSMPQRVTVFEIDRRVVDFVRESAVRFKLPISAECVDLREPLPSMLRGRFHTFVTDPSETLPGLKMFLGRGLFLLKPGEGRAGYFGLTSIEASTRKWGTIQRWLLTNHATAITHILPGTAYYNNWSDLLEQTACFSIECFTYEPKSRWFNSSLIRLETLQGFRPRSTGKIRGSVFMDHEACGEIRDEAR